MSFNTLLVPGFHGSGEAHWQSWLEKELPAARRVSGIDWERPIVHNWAAAIIRELDSNTQKSVIVAHSFGCLASAMAIANRPHHVAGVILVAPADPQRFGYYGTRENEHADYPSIAELLPERSLEVPGMLIGSRNDPWMKFAHAHAWSKRWNLAFHDAGFAGHINVESGFGPWPLIRFFTEALHEILNAKVNRTAKSDRVNRFLPPSSFVFNQHHLLYA